MKIIRHRLHEDGGAPVPFKRSPNQGGAYQAKYLIIHYTAGASAESSIRALSNPERKVSAHLVIGRDGAITQLVPFNRIAFHAGKSKWHGLSGLNRHSIGIELDNAGAMERQNGVWKSWFKRAYDDDVVIEAVHRHESESRGWHVFTEDQITATVEASQAIMRHYGLLDVLGHDDISPGRKTDPGPAFPMDSFRAAVIGRDEDEPAEFVTTTALNIREGPGTEFDRLQESPLPPGTRLTLESREGIWCFVVVLGSDGTPTATGWVHGNFIRPV